MPVKIIVEVPQHVVDQHRPRPSDSVRDLLYVPVDVFPPRPIWSHDCMSPPVRSPTMTYFKRLYACRDCEEVFFWFSAGEGDKEPICPLCKGSADVAD